MFKPVIGAANQKGGVGKTTVIRIIAEYLTLHAKKKTLLCDMDSQYSLSARYLGTNKNPVTGFKEPPLHKSYDPDDPSNEDWNGKSSIGNIFFGEDVLPYPTRIDLLEIAPADEWKLREAEEVKRQEVAEKIHYRLHQFLTLREVQAEYDCFALDTPPAKGPLTIAAFKAMTHLIIPLEMEQQAIEGLQGILTLWKQEALQRPASYPLRLLGVIPNKYHSRRGQDERLYNELKAIIGEDNIVPFRLYDRKQYPEVDGRNISIFDLPPRDEARKECMELCEYLTKRIFNS